MAGNRNSGRKPKPAALKRMTGNPGKRPIPQEPTPKAGSKLTCPAHFSGPAKTEYQRITKLMPEDWVMATDRAVLTAYCDAWGVYVAASKEVTKRGLIVMDKRVPKLNPAQRIAQNALAEMTRYAVELGFTPSARSRVGINPAGSQEYEV